ncbi:hypothetical protein NBRC116594_08850 [Shimia sp. NS0008-38b]
MAEIENPWHSRPLDVHRWSDYPEVKSFVEMIWDQYVEETVPEKGRNLNRVDFANNRPSLRTRLRSALGDLLSCERLLFRDLYSTYSKSHYSLLPYCIATKIC